MRQKGGFEPVEVRKTTSYEGIKLEVDPGDAQVLAQHVHLVVLGEDGAAVRGVDGPQRTHLNPLCVECVDVHH